MLFFLLFLLPARIYAIQLNYAPGVHPRIFITKDIVRAQSDPDLVYIQDIVSKVRPGGALESVYNELKSKIRANPNAGAGQYNFGHGINAALVYVLEKEMGNDTEANEFLGFAKRFLTSDGKNLVSKGQGVLREGPIIYDWIYEGLTSSERSTTYDFYFSQIQNAASPNNYADNYHFMYAALPADLIVTAMAIWNDGTGNTTIQNRLDQLEGFYKNTMLPAYQLAGAAWPDSEYYDLERNESGNLAMLVHLWDEATGETTWNGLPITHSDILTYYLMAKKANGTTIHYADQHGTTPWINRAMPGSLFEFHNKNLVGQWVENWRINNPKWNTHFQHWQRILWLENLSKPDLSSLPTAKYFEGTQPGLDLGIVVFRDKWTLDGSDTKIFFISGNLFSSKNHFNANHFGIYKDGDLALENGADEVICGHDSSGGCRITFGDSTVGKNSITVSDPTVMLDEGQEYIINAGTGAKTNSSDWNTFGSFPWANNGDTRVSDHQPNSWTDGGDILRFETTAGYDYVVGDASKAYRFGPGLSHNRLTVFQRELAFLNKKYLVVFDRVSAVNPDFIKRWYLHTVLEPTMSGAKVSDVSTTEDGSGNRIECQVPGCSGASEWDGKSMSLLSSKSGWNPSGDDGKLFLKMLLPQDATFRKRGGDGFEHWRHNRNFPFSGNKSITGRPSYEGRGKWRVEEETSGRTNDIFLNILYPTGATVTSMPETLLIDSTIMKGAHVKDSSLNLVALFSADPQGASPTGGFIYTISPTANSRHFLFNLPPTTTFSVVVSSAGSEQTITVSPSAAGSMTSPQGVLVFDVADTGVVQETPPAPPTGLKVQ